jgi:hypothetical protein
MKKTLLLLFLCSVTGTFAQFFNTGEQQLLANLTASISINGNTGMTTLTLTGPSNAWFAIGFGALNMSGGADVFRTDGSDHVDAKSTGRFLPPADASQDWTVTSNTVNAGLRTIVAIRANDTGDPDDFVFSAQEGSIPLIYAHGNTTAYTQHSGSNRGFTTIGVLSSRDEGSLFSFQMFPNPSTDVVNIQLPTGTEKAEVGVFDTRGRQVSLKTVTLTDKQLNVSNLSSGMYIVRVTTNHQIGTQRLIKE